MAQVGAALDRRADRPAARTIALAAAAAALIVAVVLHLRFQMDAAARYEFWTDELFALWAGDPSLTFGEALSTRILTDSNGPIYFSLVWLARSLNSDSLAAIIWLNGIATTLVLTLTAALGWRARAPATTLTLLAAFLLGAPALSYGLEARCYGLAMTVSVAISVLAAGALVTQPRRLEWVAAVPCPASRPGSTSTARSMPARSARAWSPWVSSTRRGATPGGSACWSAPPPRWLWPPGSSPPCPCSPARRREASGFHSTGPR